MQSVTFAFVWAIVLLLASSCFSYPAIYEEDKQHEECKDLTGKDDQETKKLRHDCHDVFNNEYVKWSEKMLSDRKFANSLEVVNMTEDDDTEPNDGKTKLQRNKRSVNYNCPLFDDAYLSKSTKPKERSLSPWRYVNNIHPARIPREILDSRCLCRGCIDMRSRAEDTSNLHSTPMRITIPVLYTKYNKFHKIVIQVGCTCKVLISYNN